MSLQLETERRTIDPKVPGLKTGETTLSADEDRCVHHISTIISFSCVCCTGCLCTATVARSVLARPGLL